MVVASSKSRIRAVLASQTYARIHTGVLSNACKHVHATPTHSGDGPFPRQSQPRLAVRRIGQVDLLHPRGYISCDRRFRARAHCTNDISNAWSEQRAHAGANNLTAHHGSNVRVTLTTQLNVCTGVGLRFFGFIDYYVYAYTCSCCTRPIQYIYI